jgi:hypothetical protein
LALLRNHAGTRSAFRVTGGAIHFAHCLHLCVAAGAPGERFFRAGAGAIHSKTWEAERDPVMEARRNASGEAKRIGTAAGRFGGN